MSCYSSWLTQKLCQDLACHAQQEYKGDWHDALLQPPPGYILYWCNSYPRPCVLFGSKAELLNTAGLHKCFHLQVLPEAHGMMSLRQTGHATAYGAGDVGPGALCCVVCSNHMSGLPEKETVRRVVWSSAASSGPLLATGVEGSSLSVPREVRLSSFLACRSLGHSQVMCSCWKNSCRQD